MQHEGKRESWRSPTSGMTPYKDGQENNNSRHMLTNAGTR